MHPRGVRCRRWSDRGPGTSWPRRLPGPLCSQHWACREKRADSWTFGPLLFYLAAADQLVAGPTVQTIADAPKDSPRWLAAVLGRTGLGLAATRPVGSHPASHRLRTGRYGRFTSP